MITHTTAFLAELVNCDDNSQQWSTFFIELSLQGESIIRTYDKQFAIRLQTQL